MDSAAHEKLGNCRNSHTIERWGGRTKVYRLVLWILQHDTEEESPMDPITAVSLAANVFQFIDFAGRLFSLGKEIHQAGASKRNLDLEVIVDDITALSLKLKDDTSPFARSTRLNDDDQVSFLAIVIRHPAHCPPGVAQPRNRMHPNRRRTIKPT
jgi:hypothetical protein